MIDPIFSITPAQSAAAAATEASDGDGADFSSLISGVVADVSNSLGAAERHSIEALQGKGDARQVVDSIMHAEQSLQTALAIRDKLVSAFQEITRMTI
ncbi:MAG: flagellar hook-basal body complex protein FliE [Hyphomicrobiales bacterium]|nr:flagellar hook-basal body complex protein FliE [Hyphomicrobiales bacterium]